MLCTQLPLYQMPSRCGAIGKHHSYGRYLFINSSTCNSFTSSVKAKHSRFHFNRWHRSKDCVLCFVKKKKTNRNSSISCSQGWLTTHCTAKKDQEILTFFFFIFWVLGLQVYTAMFGLFDAKDQTWVLYKLGQHWTIWVKSPGRSPSAFPQGFVPPSQEHRTAQPRKSCSAILASCGKSMLSLLYR